MKVLSEIPDNITYLDCSNSGLTSLPELPKTLVYLNCSDNNLTSLPELPNSLKYLYCKNNNLTSIPKLPKSLLNLECSNNKLIYLPELFDSLIYLSCSQNNFISLPKISRQILSINHIRNIGYWSLHNPKKHWTHYIKAQWIFHRYILRRRFYKKLDGMIELATRPEHKATYYLFKREDKNFKLTYEEYLKELHPDESIYSRVLSMIRWGLQKLCIFKK